MKKTIVALAFVALLGCAARPPHVKLAQAPIRNCNGPKDVGPCLEEASWDGQGNLIQGWRPSQLTPAGCVLHQMLFWHKPLECK